MDLATGAPKQIRGTAWLIGAAITVLGLGALMGARQQNLVDDVAAHETADATLHAQQNSALDETKRDLKSHLADSAKHDQRVDQAILQINDTLKFMAGKKLHLRDPATDSPEGDSP